MNENLLPRILWWDCGCCFDCVCGLIVRAGEMANSEVCLACAGEASDEGLS